MRTVRPARPHSRFFRLSPLAASLALAFTPAAAVAGDYFVSNTNDSGAGSLRQAILDANASCGGDLNPVIKFDIPTGPFVIAPSTELPAFVCYTGPYSPTVDGTSHPNWTANSSPDSFNATLPIELSGGADYMSCGLQLYDPYYGGMLTVQGLVIRDFNYGGSGYGLCGKLQAFGNSISNNASGINAGQGSTIGDSSPAGRNVIAANLYAGIYISNSGSIINNLIGTFDGGSPASNGTGISSDYGPLTISGNVISGNTNEGIYLWGDGGSTITGNKIGTNAAGTFALGNGYGVVLDYSYGANITGNVISGNTQSGVDAYYDGGSTISGNSIGTNDARTAPIPNATGITLNYSYGGTTITGNTISGNSGTGIDLYQSNGISISGNTIGTNFGSAAGLGNNTGLSAYCSNGNTFSNNSIAGNAGDGMWLYGVTTSTISGNFIGVGPTGAVRPNSGNGIGVESGGSCGYASDNNGFYSNQIANNGDSGILLYSGVGNRISANSIYNNAEKNININGNDGPTPNDPGDADIGPNNQQNWPVINSVAHVGGNTLVNITLDSAPSTFTEFRIEFFENPAPGTPAGRTYVGSYDLHINNAPGPVSATVTLDGLYNFISATAISNATNDTSEFSPIASLSSTPAATVSPSTLTFTTPVGATSESQTATIFSSGSGPYVINTFDSGSSCYGGPFCYGGDFTCSTTCSTGTAYAPGGRCTVSANFHPSYIGRQSTTIYICDNTSASPHAITLTGDGVVPPVLTITPESWDFGTLNAGFKSAPKTFVVDNPSGSPAVLGPPYVTGDFSLEGTDCGSTLQAGEHCSAQVSFIPLRAGYVTGELIVPIGDTPKRGGKVLIEGPPPSSSSARAALSGTGSELGHVQLPNAIDLGAYTLGSPPLFFTFELRNDGAQGVTVSSINTAAPFTSTNNCPQTLAVGQACTITVGFSATVAGDYAGTLNIVTNAQDGSRAIPITARAQGSPLPIISVSQSFVGFGDRMIGTESEPQRLTIRNNGGADATLQAIGRNAAGLDYLVTTTCGLTLAPAQTCFADVVFRPVGFGPRPGLFEVFSNTVGSPAVVELTGTGCRPFVSSGRRGGGLNCAP